MFIGGCRVGVRPFPAEELRCGELGVEGTAGVLIPHCSAPLLLSQVPADTDKTRVAYQGLQTPCSHTPHNIPVRLTVLTAMYTQGGRTSKRLCDVAGTTR